MADVNIWIGKIHIDGVDAGWSESYIIPGSAAGDATAKLASVITARKALLSDKLDIVYANVSRFGVKRDSYIALLNPVSGDNTATTWVPNRLNDALLLRQQTADGKVANRYLHGIPDTCIVNGEYDATALAGAFETALTTYRASLISNTAYLAKDKTVTPTVLSTVAFALTANRGITGHKVGRPFTTRPGRRKVA